VAEGSPPESGLSEEELRRLEEQLRSIGVADVLVQTVLTLSSLGFARLAAGERDLEQARLAIDAIGAIVPLLEGAVPSQTVRDFSQMKANLQLAYASAVSEGGSAGDEPAAERPPEDAAPDSGSAPGDVDAPDDGE
jgi:hypothetical protein